MSEHNKPVHRCYRIRRMLDACWQKFPASAAIVTLRVLIGSIAFVATLFLGLLPFAESPKPASPQSQLSAAAAPASPPAGELSLEANADSNFGAEREAGRAEGDTAKAEGNALVSTSGTNKIATFLRISAALFSSVVKGNELIWAIALGIIQAIAWCGLFLLKRSGARDSEKRELLDRVVNHYQSRLAPSEQKPEYIYRLTLFRCRRIPLVGRWLGICARSGETHRKWTTIFSIDTETECGCTGVAGRCWWRAAHHRSYSTLVEFINESDTNDRTSTYATQCGITTDEASALTVASTRFAATPVMQNGRVWGVLVFDTTDPAWANSEPMKREIRKTADDVAATLSFLVSK